MHKPLSDDDINEILQIMDESPRKRKWAKFGALDSAKRVAFKQRINSISKNVEHQLKAPLPLAIQAPDENASARLTARPTGS